MARRWNRFLLALGLLTSPPACAPAVPSLQRDVKQLRNEVEKLRSDADERRELAALYNCPTEFRHMYQAIAQECSEHRSRYHRDLCPHEVVGESIRSQEKRLDVQFSALVRRFMHTVAYLSPLHEKGRSAPVVGRAHSLQKNREAILRLTLSPPWPAAMRILLITPPGPPDQPNQAAQRLAWVVEYLQQRGLTTDQLEPPLVFDLGLKTEYLFPLERAVPPEIDDLSKAVWMIRLDCPRDLRSPSPPRSGATP